MFSVFIIIVVLVILLDLIVAMTTVILHLVQQSLRLNLGVMIIISSCKARNWMYCMGDRIFLCNIGYL